MPLHPASTWTLNGSISYAHDDIVMLRELQIYPRLIGRAFGIRFGIDGTFHGGRRWRQKIQCAIGGHKSSCCWSATATLPATSSTNTSCRPSRRGSWAFAAPEFRVSEGAAAKLRAGRASQASGASGRRPRAGGVGGFQVPAERNRNLPYSLGGGPAKGHGGRRGLPAYTLFTNEQLADMV
jgi:hypothetical protein